MATLVSATAAATGKLVPAAVLATTALRFAVTGACQLATTDEHLVEARRRSRRSVSVHAAVCAALAMMLEDAARETRLPLGRRGTGRESLTGGLSEQVQSVEREAGVREQL